MLVVKSYVHKPWKALKNQEIFMHRNCAGIKELLTGFLKPKRKQGYAQETYAQLTGAVYKKKLTNGS